MNCIRKNKLFPVVLVIVLCLTGLFTSCTNGERSYRITGVTFSKGMDSLFNRRKMADFKRNVQAATLEISIQNDTLMIVRGLPGSTELQLHRLKARKNSDMPKHTYRLSDKDGNTLDVSLSGTGFKKLTIRTRALILFPEKIGTDKLTLSASDQRKWLSTVEMNGEKI